MGIFHTAKSGAETSDSRGSSRRNFLRYAGGAGVVATALVACNKDGSPAIGSGKIFDKLVALGSGDTGILNYAYALEQLEAAFYIKVLQNPYVGMVSSTMAMFSDIRDHEICHREFFKTALGSNAIPELSFNFNSIDFTSRASVLGTAQAFEDTGVSAYNGAGKLIANPAYLTLAGKIVSVEARHAAYIRELVSANSFANSSVVDANGLDKSRTPAQVLDIVAKYINLQIDGSKLPS